MDDEGRAGLLDKVWAAFGLVAGAALIWMAVDVLRGRPAAGEEAGDGG